MVTPASLRARAASGGFASVGAGVVRSDWWAAAVLVGVVVVLLFLSGPLRFRGFPVAIVIASGVTLGMLMWLVLDIADVRFASRPLSLVLVAAGVFLAAWTVDVALHRPGVEGLNRLHLVILAAAATAAGAYARWAFGRERPARQVVALAAIVSSAASFDLAVLARPLNDARIYIDAGTAFLQGAPVYITSPLTSLPRDYADLPYVYPPFTLPFLGALASLPHPLGLAILVGGCGVSVVIALRLLGVRWPLVPAVLIWAPIATGVDSGNVACFGFLILAATWRFAAAAPLAGIFKPQSGLIALWLVRERRWRSLVVGVGVILALILVTLPLTGIAMYGDYLRALGYFQDTLETFPSLMGLTLQRYLPIPLAIAVSGVAIILALRARRREGLARLAIASIVVSPTLYIHGLMFGLPAILALDATLAWGLMAVAPWGFGAWWALGLAFLALVVGLNRSRLATTVVSRPQAPDGEDATPPAELPYDASVHPLGTLLVPWPDASGRQA